MSKAIEYQAIRTIQVAGGKPLVAFSAPSLEINSWAGVPQKKGGEGQEETVGFQRDEDPGRVRSLSSFLQNPDNVVQNALLCARRVTTVGSIEFVPHDKTLTEDDLAAAGSVPGTLRVEVKNLDAMPLLQLVEGVMQQIEPRLPEDFDKTPDPERVADMRDRLREPVEDGEADGGEADEANEADDGGDEDAAVGDEAMDALFTEESHVADFWMELATRAAAIQELPGFSANEAEGFTRDALTAFLKPVVVVDGQHRLRGAVQAARDRMQNDPALREEAVRLADEGVAAPEAKAAVRLKADRLIPVSLVWADDPAEHVFQFVVVNQKATPIRNALLGTILSTTLTLEELTAVRERLEGAGIKLQQARSVAYMTRNPASPFYGKVETGLVGEGGSKLAWTVMQSLIRIFQELKGGNLYHQTNRDHADYWRQRQLPRSQLVAGWEERGVASAHDDWRRADGPWREVFIAFYAKVRDYFANTTDDDARNYWGDPKVSNLFNKIYLTILAADFFQYLDQTKQTIDSADDIGTLVDEWLVDVKPDYFTGDWPLQGKKKDSPGIRKRWADLWEGYRTSPDKSLPQKQRFGQPM